MILGIGIDNVEIARFKDWHSRPLQQLLRIFTSNEISYCLANPTKSAERFAARFAAKEALYKALSAHFKKEISFLTLCPLAEVSIYAKELTINWSRLATNLPINDLCIHLSMTHSSLSASAVVIIELKNIAQIKDLSILSIDNASESSRL